MTDRWTKASLAAVAVAVSASSCIDAAASEAGDLRAIAIGLPQALQDCTQQPQAMQARLWTSGHEAPCALDVDLEARTTSGVCDITPGIERTLTLEWFLDEGGGTTLVLAQATTTLDLAQARDDTANATFTDDDVTLTECLDHSAGGSPRIVRGGVPVPVCDVDDSGSPNLIEVCAASDPFDARSEPL